MTKITIRTLRNTRLLELYKKLISNSDLNSVERESLLKIAVLLINGGDKFSQELGYRIIVLYSNLVNDYVPLYDVALNKGIIPLCKLLENMEGFSDLFDDSFFRSYHSSLNETYKSENIYLTTQQKTLASFFEDNNNQTLAVVAPTSYGKSELFIKFCKRNRDSRICMLVPTKSLLAQTRRRILHDLDSNDPRKIITHPEMYNSGDQRLLAILTQERLLRLLNKDSGLMFDFVFIDEAHNLLDGGQRNILLSIVITLLEKRNQEVVFKFLTPYLVTPSNLETKFTEYTINDYTIDEIIKTETYYAIDFRKDSVLKIYDQFLNEFIEQEEYGDKDEVEFILENKKHKNIIYFNSPSTIERFAKDLIAETEVVNNQELDSICSDIAEFLHKDYAMIDCIQSGFVYHHGSVPDIIKLYIENLFSKNEHISFIITTSTLLEGVNIPAERLFLLQHKKGPRNLSPSQFKNLAGRVCRFSELFSPDNGSPNMLEPSIYVIGSQYVGVRSNIEKFLQSRVKIDKKVKDTLDNVLLKSTTITEENEQIENKAHEVLENIEPGVTQSESEYAQTEVGKACFLNNITEIPIVEYEYEIQQFLTRYESDKIDTTAGLLDCIVNGFLQYINESRPEYQRLARLNKKAARRFYAKFLDWRLKNASYNEMINGFLKYWKNLDDKNFVYVGNWGEIVKEGFRKLWVNIGSKSTKEQVNLAIVRIKEEQDFSDNFLMKYAEVLNDLNLLNTKFYRKLKYGTKDARVISMIKNGISKALASLLLEEYPDMVNVNVQSDMVEIDPAVVRQMESNSENRILTFEASFNVRN